MWQQYRGLIRGRTRIAMAWLFVIILCFFAREYPTPPGIILCFFGASLRYWASGYLRKDSRPAVGGPYAWVRNPLYLGTYLMAVGTAWAIGQWVILGVLTVGFAAIYHYIILDEEVKLQGIFGAPYDRYRQLVPRFFPRPWPAARQKLQEVNPEPAHHEFDRQLARKNKAYEAYVTFLAMIGLVAVAAFFWQR